MAKMACAQCGGTKKMQVGGRSIPFPIIPPRRYRTSMEEGEDGVWRSKFSDYSEPTKSTKKTANRVRRKAAVNKVKKTVRKIGKALSPKYQEGGSTTTKMAKGGSSKSCPPGERLVRGICTPKMLSSTGAKIGVGTVLAGAAGMIGSAIKKKVAANKTKKEETGTTMAQHRRMDRQDKRYMRKYEKQKAEELMKSKRFQKGGMTSKVLGPPKQPFAAGIPYFTGAGQTGPESMQKGGSFAPNRAVQASCKGGMVRDENGRCVMQRKMSKGGLAKAQTGTTVPAGTVVKGGKTWNGKGYNPAPVNPAPTNTVPVGTVINDGRIWNGKGYDPAPVKGKYGGAKMQMGGTTVKARKTITGGTKVKTNNGQNVTVTRRNKAGAITKQSARKAVKGWSEDDYKVGGSTKGKKMQTGGTKRPLRTKEQVYDNPYGKGKYSLGFKSSRTNPITNKTVEKSRITTGSYGTPDTETKTRTVTDRKGNVKQKIKTYDVGPVVKPSTATNLRIKEKFAADKKTKTVTKNGEGFKKTNNYLGRNKKIKLAQDAWRTYSGREKVKVSADDLKKQKVGGATKAAKFAALAPPYNKATAADRIAGAKKNARKK